MNRVTEAPPNLPGAKTHAQLLEEYDQVRKRVRADLHALSQRGKPLSFWQELKQSFGFKGARR